MTISHKKLYIKKSLLLIFVIWPSFFCGRPAICFMSLGKGILNSGLPIPQKSNPSLTPFGIHTLVSPLLKPLPKGLPLRPMSVFLACINGGTPLGCVPTWIYMWAPWVCLPWPPCCCLPVGYTYFQNIAPV